ncbi:MAG TPA: hypothetical protein VLY83_01700 [Methanoregula sp.]|nr:hypothetical protein [Methanoregula sp.]
MAYRIIAESGNGEHLLISEGGELGRIYSPATGKYTKPIVVNSLLHRGRWHPYHGTFVLPGTIPPL